MRAISEDVPKSTTPHLPSISEDQEFPMEVNDYIEMRDDTDIRNERLLSAISEDQFNLIFMDSPTVPPPPPNEEHELEVAFARDLTINDELDTLLTAICNDEMREHIMDTGHLCEDLPELNLSFELA